MKKTKNRKNVPRVACFLRSEDTGGQTKNKTDYTLHKVWSTFGCCLHISSSLRTVCWCCSLNLLHRHSVTDFLFFKGPHACMNTAWCVCAKSDSNDNTVRPLLTLCCTSFLFIFSSGRCRTNITLQKLLLIFLGDDIFITSVHGSNFPVGCASAGAASSRPAANAASLFLYIYLYLYSLASSSRYMRMVQEEALEEKLQSGPKDPESGDH